MVGSAVCAAFRRDAGTGCSYGCDHDGQTAAVLTSLIATSKRLGIEPLTHGRDILKRINGHPQTRLAELLPEQWKLAEQDLAGKKVGP